MTATTFVLSAPLYLAMGVLALFLGDQVTRRIAVLRELCIPRPVTAGLLFAGLNGILTQVLGFELRLEGDLRSELWSVLFTAVPPDQPLQVDQPFLIAFFTCVGLSCSTAAIREGGRSFAALLATASLLALLQAFLGIGLAVAWGYHPGLGLACGPVSMTGGHGTTAGFAALLESTGLSEARAVGFAAATVGLLIGGIVAGPLGSWLIRRQGLSPSEDTVPETVDVPPGEEGILRDLGTLRVRWRTALLLFAILLVCFKAGAWLSYGLNQMGLVFPVYMGSMIVGALVRNGSAPFGLPDLDSLLPPVRSVCIAMFLVLALMDTSFGALADVALPMLTILLGQVLLAMAFAAWVTFRFAGRDYGAAVVAAGHCGFALGATPNALAAMEAISRRHGRVFRPFLAVSLAGGFFLDFANALVIIGAVNWILA